MPRQVFHALNMRYKGQPTLSVTIDGTAKVSSQQMPSHSVMRNRRMELPAGVVGYVPQIQSTFTEALTTEFEPTPEGQYAQQQLFHFFEVQFDGTVKLEIYSDEIRQVPNNSGETSITLTVRDSKKAGYPKSILSGTDIWLGSTAKTCCKFRSGRASIQVITEIIALTFLTG